MTPSELRNLWRQREEVALFDAREEGPFAEAHPFFAVPLSPSRIEMSIYGLVPRRTTPVVVYDGGEGLASGTAARLRHLGYSEVSVLEGGIEGWVAAGGELFRDVNVPIKAFGELVEATCHTPSLSAAEVHQLITERTDMVVVDVRRFSEYQTMSIPSGMSVPGTELALRIRDMAPSPDTLVVVNCAGRTRSIIGAQTLVNSGIPNRVAALRNGTIGWTLAGLRLEHGQSRHAEDSPVSAQSLAAALRSAERCATATGVREIDRQTLEQYRAEDTRRTLYCLDVRTQHEYEARHPAGFFWAAGGQLVQATDEWLAVRGARVVLYSDEGVRALMTGSWLAQMGWDVSVLKPETITDCETGPASPPRPLYPVPHAATISAAQLAASSSAIVVDLAPSPVYHRGHIPGAFFLLRSRFAADAHKLPAGGPIVVTSPDGVLAGYAAADLGRAAGRPVNVLDGGSAGWVQAGFKFETARHHYVSPAIDVYKRPYEGTDSTAEAMRGYIEWELKLVEQMARDGVANFRVMTSLSGPKIC